MSVWLWYECLAMKNTVVSEYLWLVLYLEFINSTQTPSLQVLKFGWFKILKKVLESPYGSKENHTEVMKMLTILPFSISSISKFRKLIFQKTNCWTRSTFISWGKRSCWKWEFDSISRKSQLVIEWTRNRADSLESRLWTKTGPGHDEDGKGQVRFSKNGHEFLFIFFLSKSKFEQGKMNFAFHTILFITYSNT